MKTIIIMQKLLMTLVGVAFLGAGILAVSQQADAQPAWMPKPPKAVGGQCDADPKWMRKWHMNVLDHKRDETMHDGIRTAKYSLKNCITCHAVKDEKTNKYLTIKDERHFCRACHDYAAVRMDCFDCHASRPDEKMSKAAKAKGNPHKKGTPYTRNGSSKKSQDTALATLQKYLAGEGK